MQHNNENCLHEIDTMIFTAERNPVAKFQSPLKSKHRTLAITEKVHLITVMTVFI